MSVKSKEILEHFESEEKNRDEVSGLMDQLAENYSQEIEMLADNRRDRLERHAAMATRITAEIDKQADLLIRRKDLVMDIKEKLNGNHPEPIVLNPADVVFLDGKPERQGLFRRRRTARAA